MTILSLSFWNSCAPDNCCQSGRERERLGESERHTGRVHFRVCFSLRVAHLPLLLAASPPPPTYAILIDCIVRDPQVFLGVVPQVFPFLQNILLQFTKISMPSHKFN